MPDTPGIPWPEGAAHLIIEGRPKPTFRGLDSTHEPEDQPDPIGYLIAAVDLINQARRFLYVRSNHITGQILVLGPQVTGADRDVHVIPVGPEGDRILQAVADLCREPVEWQQTPAELARVMSQWPFGAPHPGRMPCRVEIAGA